MSQKFLYSPDAFFRLLASVSQNCVLKNGMSLALSVQPSVLLLPLPFAHSYRAHDVAAAAAPLRDNSPLASPLQQPHSAVDRDSAVWRERGTAMSKCGQSRGICAQVLRVTRPSQHPPADRARVASLLFPAVEATLPPIALAEVPPDPFPFNIPHHQLRPIEINNFHPQQTSFYQTQPGSVNQPRIKRKGRSGISGSTRRTSSTLSTTGNFAGRLARVASVSSFCSSTWVYRKRIAESAWFCVLAATFRSIARYDRIALPHCFPVLQGVATSPPALDEIGGSGQSSCGKPPPSELT